MNIQRWNLALTPLSPVHMGTDSDYEPSGYVIDEGVLYQFDGPTALSVLPDSKRDEFNQLLSNRDSQKILQQIQSFFFSQKEALKSVSYNQVQVSPEMEAFYKDRIGRVSQYEDGGRKVHNKLEIERCAWNPVDQNAVMPGSGLKGAMRTALLDKLNNGRSVDKRVKNRELQEALFQGSFSTDPLRLLKITDANTEGVGGFSTQVRFALNRKKKPVTNKHGTLLQSQAEQRGLYQLLECLPPLIPRAFLGSLDLQIEQQMSHKKWPALQFDLNTVVGACNDYYYDKLNQELQQLDERGFLDVSWTNQLQTLLSASWLKQALNQKRAFFLRVGRHCGAESVTLNGKGVRNIKIMKGRGERPDYQDHTKTVWLAGDERQLQTNMQPFGWVLVELFKDDEVLPEWPEGAINHNMMNWQNQIEEQREAAAERLREQQESERLAQEEIMKEQAEREASKRAQEEFERAEAARRKAEFDALSENRKIVHQLQQNLEVIKKQPVALRDTSMINSQLKSIVDAASAWDSVDERTELADFMEDYYDLTGWHQTGIKSAKKKKQEKKKRDLIQNIRTGHL